MSTRPVIALTGGPGGGKSALIEDLSRDPAWAGRFVAWPETAQVASFTTISPEEKLFQRVVVNLQMALEDGLDRALGQDDPRAIICHRGSLDPLAFWRQRGWPEREFFEFTDGGGSRGMTRLAAARRTRSMALGASVGPTSAAAPGADGGERGSRGPWIRRLDQAVQR